MEKTLVIHGRQQELGRAELESIYGADKVRAVHNDASLVDMDHESFDFSRLGGMVKFCKVLLKLDTTDWSEITDFLCQSAPEHAKRLDEGRLTIGLSVYGIKTNIKAINNTGIRLKRAIKDSGRSVRIVPNKSPTLNAAQVLHNKLTQRFGWELILLKNGSETIIAQSIAVQDIEKYAARDQTRPSRDAKVGMLPPKLAQIIINLAVGSFERKLVCNTPVDKDGTAVDIKVLDPFCGSGVILQEALLMDLNAYGSDIDQLMMDYSKSNLDWLKEKFGYKGSVAFETADATSHKWKYKFDTVASEAYLGKPLSTLPKPEILKSVAFECDKIIERFLQNLASQTKEGFRLCLAVPAWRQKNDFLHLKTLDKLSDLGYNRVKFAHVSNQGLIYHRPDQIVARELVVLERK